MLKWLSATGKTNIFDTKLINYLTDIYSLGYPIKCVGRTHVVNYYRNVGECLDLIFKGSALILTQ